MMNNTLFYNRKLVIATMHGKETVLAPLLQQQLGVVCITTPLDTDQFGTFSGEVERRGSPLDAAIAKCRLACAAVGTDLAVASEGSFGPHPVIGLVPGNDELVVLLDLKNNLQIAARHLTTDTNFAGRHVGSKQALKQFAAQIGFPQHALILKDRETAASKVIKGINSADVLYASFDEMGGYAWAETDMRAMMNPLRMKAIAAAGEKLVKKINSLCPVCSMPGFSVTGAIEGLPCELCRRPTSGVLMYTFTCEACSHTEERIPAGRSSFQDPMYCDYCNP